jgi:hypothetical protein
MPWSAKPCSLLQCQQPDVKGGGAAVTNSAGQLVLSYAASGGTADVITVKSMGESASAGIVINASTFSIKVLDAVGNVQTSAPSAAASRSPSRAPGRCCHHQQLARHRV